MLTWPALLLLLLFDWLQKFMSSHVRAFHKPHTCTCNCDAQQPNMAC